MKFYIFFSSIVILFISSCAEKKEEKPFDYGKVINQVYQNKFFHVQIPIPQKCEFIIQKESAKKNHKIFPSSIKIAELLTVFLDKQGTTFDYNGNILINVENLKDRPEIKNGNHYLKEAIKGIEKSGLNIKVLSSDVEKVMLNGEKFHKISTLFNTDKFNINVDYYSTIINGFAFNLVVSYVSDFQKGELSKILNEINLCHY